MLHLEQAGGWMPGTFNYYNGIGEVRGYRGRLRVNVTVVMRMASSGTLRLETKPLAVATYPRG